MFIEIYKKIIINAQPPDPKTSLLYLNKTLMTFKEIRKWFSYINFHPKFLSLDVHIVTPKR